MKEKELLTNSRARAFRSCPRLHDIRYNQSIAPASEPEFLRFGTLWHAGTEAWWKALREGPNDNAWLDQALDTITFAAADPLDRVRAEELMRGYHFRWWDAGYTPLEVEVEFLTALVNPETGAQSRTFELAGKIDGIVKAPDGRVLLTERKTSAENLGAGSEYWRRLTLDPQISTYFVGARSLGYDVEGCLYDVVAKPRLEPRLATPIESRKYTKDGRLYAAQRDQDEDIEEYRVRLRDHIAENPDRYYQRGEIPRLEEQEKDAAFDVWQTARLIREAKSTGHHIRNPDACSKWGTTCSFFDVCTGLTTLSDPARFRKMEDPHQELLQVKRTKEECTP